MRKEGLGFALKKCARRVQGQDSPSPTITVFSTRRFFHWKSDSQRLR